MSKRFDFCIVGSGVAGLSLALRLSKKGTVAIVTKGNLLSGSTPLAQGGIAAAMPSESEIQEHFEDTMKAGGNENDPSAVQILVKNAPGVIDDLKEWGVHFSPSLHREGGHSKARIYHSEDRSGYEIASVLSSLVRNNSNISLFENKKVFRLIDFEKEVFGIWYAEDQTQEKIAKPLFAKRTVLATGGACGIFHPCTVPEDMRGEGIAMAMCAGAETADLEIVQFHPTVLDFPKNPRFLLSEALRGAGALLVNSQHERFVDELLPRDIVSQHIFEQQKTGKVFLDARSIPEFSQKFPHIFSVLKEEFKLDPTTDLLPISPAAHFFGGGIKTDIHGKTTVKHLSAVGEAAWTGVHGRNRLASNSLLECLVFSKQIADNFLEIETEAPSFPPYQNPPKFKINTPEDISFEKSIRKKMGKYCGISRNKEDLQKVLKVVQKAIVIGTNANILKKMTSAVLESAINKI